MRLGDLDALKKEYEKSLGYIMHTGDVTSFIDAAPTVCCGDCWSTSPPAGRTAMTDLTSDLEPVTALWEFVVGCLQGMVADLDAGRPTIEELENGTAKNDELLAAVETALLREAAHEIVQAALVALQTKRD